MTELAEYALDRGIRNCGCFDVLPWPRLLQREALHSALVELGQGPALCAFLDVLERSVKEQQLIPGLVVEDEWKHLPHDRAGVYVSDLRKLAHEAMAKNSHCPQCPHVLGTGTILERSGADLPRFESVHSSDVDGFDLALPMPQPEVAFPIPTPLDNVFPSISPREVFRTFPGSRHTLSDDRPHTPVEDPRPPTPSTSDEGEDGQDLGLPIPHLEFPRGQRDEKS
ncbi:hypothetical protein PsYK624_084910 [Phanerochaete sordida]|uniref:Uncharacterized protein n=1 Tax=Phanerochaete sordida TaxID=48140 RepID=A0A9P3LFS8_9APHY|nr:hypothetical protein PsYK624_084910 [Phanerochaete sordida]